MEVDLNKHCNSRYKKPVFKSLSILGKEIANNIVDNLCLSQANYTNQKLFTI
jgi:hypothetical protein